MGEGTDIVTKEMYDFEDKGGRRIALRPEGTAPVVRAYLEHHPTDPWKVWYAAPTFRYERPQAGRYRQHHQLGVEVLGSVDADVDVEVIGPGLGLPRRASACAGSTCWSTRWASPRTGSRYAGVLQAFFREHLGRHRRGGPREGRATTRCGCSTRSGPPPPRSWPRPPARPSTSPTRPRRTSNGSRPASRPSASRSRIEPRLVRGLDYYTRTTFELQAEALDAAQNAVGGGGRYDGLAEALGGPPTPGIGFGLGIERMLAGLPTPRGSGPSPAPGVDVFVVDVTGGDVARDLTSACAGPASAPTAASTAGP